MDQQSKLDENALTDVAGGKGNVRCEYNRSIPNGTCRSSNCPYLLEDYCSFFQKKIAVIDMVTLPDADLKKL